MKQLNKSTDLKFIPHNANRNDPMDLPFRIVGHQLRWVAARSSEDRFTRPWKILRKSEMPESVIRQLSDKSLNIFRDGDTARFGENVLAYATNEAVAEARKLVSEDTRQLRESIGMNSDKRPGVVVDKRETSVERVGSAEFTD